MKKIQTIIFLSSALLCFSCTKENGSAATGAAAQGGTEFTGESRSGKLAIGDETPEGFPFLWEEGDRLKVFNTSDRTAVTDAMLTGGAGTGQGKFVAGCTLAKGSRVRLIYPAGAAYDGIHRIATDQTRSAPGEREIDAGALAYSEEIVISGENSFSLHHVPAFFRLRLMSGGSFVGFSLNSFTLRCEGVRMTGSYEIDYPTGIVSSRSDCTDCVNVTLTTPMKIGTSLQDVWFTTLPCDLQGKAVEIELHLEDKAGKAFTKTVRVIGHSVSSGRLYSLKITDATASCFIEPDFSKPEYTTTTCKWKKNGSNTDSGFSTMTAKSAEGMNWMRRANNCNIQDSWGGDASIKPDYIISSNPAGFWQVGRWRGQSVMVDPDGHIAVLRGMNNVSPEGFSAAVTDVTLASYKKAFPTDLDFARQAGQWLKEMGFNFYTSNCNRIFRYRGITSDIDKNFYANTPEMEQALQHPDANTNISQCELINMTLGFYYDFKTLTNIAPGTKLPILAMCYDPGWLDYIDKVARTCAEYFKDNRNYIGYYLDNELNLAQTGVGSYTDQPTCLKGFLLGKDATSENPRFWRYAYKFAVEWMQKNYGTDVYSESMETPFQKEVTEYYYRTACEALRRHDPNHLILGGRLNGKNRDSELVMKACAKYCDVVSINYYGHNYEAVDADFQKFQSWLGTTPFLISEMYVKGMDLQTAQEGGGDQVHSQADRGIWYDNYCISLLRQHNCAGWQWFKFQNDFNKNGNGYVNKGVLKLDYSGLLTDCTDRMASLNRNAMQVLKYFSSGQESGGDEDAGMLENVVWE